MENKTLIQNISIQIFDTFQKYLSEYYKIAGRAKKRFEYREWKEIRKNSAESLLLYDDIVGNLADKIEQKIPDAANKKAFWIQIKTSYAELLRNYCNANIAETFFNSLSRKIFKTIGINRELEFFHLISKMEEDVCGPNIYRTYHDSVSIKTLVKKIISDQNFKTGFEDLNRDTGYVSNEIGLFLWPYIRSGKTYSIDIIKSCFFRNKVAYIVGRINVDSSSIPLILPLYNDRSGIYIDSVLLNKTDANNIFSFVYSYFLININLPNQLIGFLRTILSEKQVSELYNSIGFPRQGKTDFYRDLHRFVHISKEKFEYAPGEEGAVMIVFTLPNFNYVFKVIKDKPCFILSSNITDKVISKSHVRYMYNFVSLRERAGRLVDTQEFENLRFRTKRFSKKLLEDFNKVAKDTIEIAGDYVIINHIYVQRKVIPLPIFLNTELNVDTLREIVIDFGYFFKDLAASGLFPADLFNTWNYGVTENKRIVSYDYDDIVPLENANFRIKPSAKDEFEEMSPGEEWIIAEKNDYFLDEIENYIGLPEALKGLFGSVHKDLYTFDFWDKIKKSLISEEIIDIIPYNRTKRFERISRQA